MEALSEKEPSALERFNSLSRENAESQLLSCCGAKAWAREVASRRPFGSMAELLKVADEVWWSMLSQEWLEAFRSHPKIGEKKSDAAASEQARNWSEQEQSGVKDAGATTLETLAILNRRYDQKFGFSFIVCATGKTSEEMLTILRERLENEPDEELRKAAEEQTKITELRIIKLLNQ